MLTILLGSSSLPPLTLHAAVPVALFLSPHLDDVAFSCGGTLARLAQKGWTTHLATVFTRSVLNPTGFALACQLDKGLEADVDYMALRRDEDQRFAEKAGAADLHHLDLPEAPHRGYASVRALFADVQAEDGVGEDVRARLARLIEGVYPDLLLAPQGIGGHVDHVQVIRGVLALENRPPTAWYRDTPYAIRFPDAPPSDLLPEGLRERPKNIKAALQTKLDATAAYETQLGFQFGGEKAMRAALRDFAHAEARRCNLEGAAEVFRVMPLPG